MAATATNNTILHELLSLQRESNERDSRIEGKMDSINTRMQYIEAHSEKQDIQLDKLTEILQQQSSIFPKIEAIELRQQAVLDDLTKLNYRITELENQNAKFALTVWKKIGGIILTCVVTAFAGYFLGIFGGKK